MRGLAALTVVLHHSLITFPAFFSVYGDRPAPPGWPVRLLAYTPLHVLWGGQEAVIVFFVLSGYVLARPFLRSAPTPWLPFTLRRVCRIYLPYLAALAVAALAMTLLSPSPRPELSQWFNASWWRPLDLDLAARHVTMAIDVLRDTNSVDNVVWSLVHEMRISLVFPLLMALSLRAGWAAALGVSLVASVALTLGRDSGWISAEFVVSSLAYSGTFVVFFVLGAALADRRERISALVRGLPGPARLALLAVALFLINWRWEVASGTAAYPWTAGIGAGIVIALAASGAGSKVLRAPPLIWLGRVSFSLYLVHLVVLLAAMHLLARALPPAAIAVAAPLASLAAAALMFRAVEVPAIALGRRLADTPRRRIVHTA